MLDKKEARRKYNREWARKKHGHKPQRRVTDVERAHILHFARLGYSHNEIAFLTSWSRQCVEKVIRKAGGMAALRDGRTRLAHPYPRPRAPRKSQYPAVPRKTRRLAVKLLMAEWAREEVAFLLQLPGEVVRRIDERVSTRW